MNIVGGKWSNWSGGVVCKPRAVVAPKDELELAAAVRTAVAPVRVPGTGHSFTPLNATDGTIVDLAAFTGLSGFDHEAGVGTFHAATPLWEIGSLIHPLGYALKNMGDIDRQTLAGVVGTGTHGTGPALGSFSSEVASFRLLLATGEIIHCDASENTEVFAAGRCAMGALGVMVEIGMKLRPIYRLAEKNFLLPVEELWPQLESLIAANRHFEFFWFPYSDVAVCKTLNESANAAPDPRSAEQARARGEKRGYQTFVFEAINEALPYAPFLLRPAHRLFSGNMAASGRVRWSHEILPSARTTRFNEMEYAVAYEKGAETVREIAAQIRRQRVNTGFPIEFRTVAADDVWLSPFYERKSVTIAVHQYHRVDTSKLLSLCESIFRSVEGRPHWGKRHTRTADDLAQLYPRFEDFRALRRRLDPSGKFLNDYLRALLA